MIPQVRIFTFFHPGIFTIIHPPPGFLFKFLTASFLQGNHNTSFCREEGSARFPIEGQKRERRPISNRKLEKNLFCMAVAAFSRGLP
jgi:hypothetical protein